MMASDSADRPQSWKMGEYVVDLGHQEVFDLWWSIGIWAGFSSDAQIATFLIQQFEKAHCMHCKDPLSMYCTRCGPSPSQQSSASEQPVSINLPVSSEQPQLAGQAPPAEHPPSGPATVDVAESKVDTSDLSALAASALSQMRAMDGENHTQPEINIQAKESTSGDAGSLLAVVKSESGSSSTTDQAQLPATADRNVTSDKPFFKEPSNIFLAANLPTQEQLSRAISAAFGEQSKQTKSSPSHMRLSSSALAKSAKRKAKISRGISKGGSKSGPLKKRGRREKNESVKIEKRVDQYVCKICGDNFSGLAVYRKHMKTHGIDKPFDCTKCNESFASGGHIKRHTCLKKSNTPQKTAKPFVCNQCDSAYSLKCNLKRHLLVHTGSRQQFVCEVCNATFFEKQSLFLHSKTHTSERPYQCSVCGATFRLPSCLNKHSKRHKEEKPYVCTECGFAFRAKDYLRQHMRTHTGERPFVCEICGAGFAQKGSLNSHKKTHKNDM